MNRTTKKQLEKIIIEYKKEYSTQEIINSFIHLYILKNEYNETFINKFSECSKYLESENSTLKNLLENKYNTITIKDIEAVFESLIDLDRKKAEGAVYTPDYIIDYIINHSISIYDGNDIPTICDPSCGSGGFVVRAILILSKKYNISEKEALKFVRGVDINEQSVSCAKIIIELYFFSKDIEIHNLDSTIINNDTLLSSRENLLKQLHITNGIDILVTNPPYVKLQNISRDYRKSLIDIYPNFTKGSFSFAMLFLIAGRNLLSKNGILGYITQNNFFTSLASKNIRQHLQDEQCVHTIIDFLHTKIFENASAYTCLIFLTKSDKINEFDFKWSLNPKTTLSNNNFSKILVTSLNSKKWRLAPSPHLENIEKIENIRTKLGDIADIKVVFATLKDKVFLLDKNNKIDLEDDITVSAVKISDLSDQDSLKDNYRRIIFPYKKIDDKYIAYTEEEMKELFPKAYQYLLNNKELLETRSEGKNPLTYFYEWGRIQGMSAPSDKLLTKTFSGKPNFMRDTTSSLFCNGYSVKPKDEMCLLIFGEILDIEILQKVLNSKIMDYYSKLTSFQLYGNYQCFQHNFIELFSIPKLTNKDIVFIKNNSNVDLDKYLAELYDINFSDILEIVNR